MSELLTSVYKLVFEAYYSRCDGLKRLIILTVFYVYRIHKFLIKKVIFFFLKSSYMYEHHP